MPATAYGHMHLHTNVRSKCSMSTIVLRYVFCCCLSLVAVVCCECIPPSPPLCRWYHYNPHEIAVLDSEISMDPSIAPPTWKNPLSLLHQLSQVSQTTSAPESTATSPLKKSPAPSLSNAQPSTSQDGEGDNPLQHDAGAAFVLGSIKEEMEHLSHRTLSPKPVLIIGTLQESQSSDRSESRRSSASERTSSASTVRFVASEEAAALPNVGALSAKEAQSLWSPSEVFGMAQNRNMSQQSSIASLHSSATGSGVPSVQISCLPSPAPDHSVRGSVWPSISQQPPATAGTYSPTASTLSAYVDDGASSAELDNSVGSTGRFPGISREPSNDLLVRSLPASSFGVMPPVATSSAYNSPTRSFKGNVSPHMGSHRGSGGSGMLSTTWNRLKSVFRSSPEGRRDSQLVAEDKDEDILQGYYNINVSVVGGQAVVVEELPESTAEEKPQELNEEVLVQRKKSPMRERPADEASEEQVELRQENAAKTADRAGGNQQEAAMREKEVSAK